MGDLIDIQVQIEKLQKQASEIKVREFDKTVQEIVMKMQAFGITLKDLRHSMGKGSKGRVRKASGKGPAVKTAAKHSQKAGVPVAPKYRGPNGETWSGRGLVPRWLSTLLAQGRSKEDFAIKH